MHPRTLLMLAVGFGLGLTFAACGTPAPACSSANCGGCCDQTGKCQSGTTADACGGNAVSCGRCGTGTVCQQGECRAGTTGGGSGGGTGGGTGGGSGGGTGTGGGSVGGGSGGGGCTVYNMLEVSQNNLALAEYRSFSANNGHYNYAGWLYLTATNPDSFRLEVVYPNDVVPQFPYTENFTAATRYRNCVACGIFYEDCAPMATACTRQYLAQSGSITITRADRAAAGRIVGSGTSLRFNEWDIGTDTSAGTRCIIVNTVGPWDVGWNADGGVIP